MRWKLLIAAYLVLPLTMTWGAGGFIVGAVIAAVSLVFLDGLPEPEITDFAHERQERRAAYLESGSGKAMFWILWLICVALYIIAVSLH